MKNMNLDRKVKQYILANIDGSGYDCEPQTDAEKVQFLRDTFYAEYGWHVNQVGETRALAEWYSGLPSACTVAFTNVEIIGLAIEWGSLPAKPTNAQCQKILGNWFNLLANKTAQLFRKHCKVAA